ANASETLAVDCGSAEETARRALRAAMTCAGVACFGVVEASPQNPRALMISVGVSGFASAFSADADLVFADWTIWESAEASWSVAAADGFARGIGTDSVDLAGAAVAVTMGAVLPPVAFSLATGALPSSSSSFDLPLNNLAHKLRLVLVIALSSPSRFSMSARASS